MFNSGDLVVLRKANTISQQEFLDKIGEVICVIYHPETSPVIGVMFRTEISFILYPNQVELIFTI